MVVASIETYERIETIEDYVFETAQTLPRGHWQITITKGYAWVFCDSGSYTLNPNDSMQITASQGEICIRRLYVKSTVKFTAVRLR